MKEPQPLWWEALDEEDRQFLKRFVLSSGSLKALCDEYGVSYPTLRARLDRLIAKVKAAARGLRVQRATTAATQARSQSWSGSDVPRSQSPGVSW